MGLEILTGLLDGKLIKIMGLFISSPEKRFYLTEVSKLSGVNTATTFRVLNKLVKEDFIKATVIGKVRTYQLSRGERARAITKLLRVRSSEEGPLELFISRIKLFPRIKLVLLDSDTANSAKVIVISDFPLGERLQKICNEIFEHTRFKIEVIEFTQKHFEDVKRLSGVRLNKKILFTRK